MVGKAVSVVVCPGKMGPGGFAETVTDGSGLTKSVTALELIVVQRPVITTLNVFVFIDTVVFETVYVLELVPARFTHADPFHCCH